MPTHDRFGNATPPEIYVEQVTLIELEPVESLAISLTSQCTNRTCSSFVNEFLEFRTL